MTHLADASSLVQANAQLPVSWYIEPQVHDIEQQNLFCRSAYYLGHALMVPNMGDFHAISWLDEAKTIVHSQNGIECLSNICRHRQAIMLNGRGNTSNIVCPLHRWTYDLKGNLLGAPHFQQNPCLKLDSIPLTNWNGLLFTGPRDVLADLGHIGVMKDLDFKGYIFDRYEITSYPFNWKTFIEVYLEDYHVAPFHPGLGQFVDCNSLQWEFGDWYSIQTVGVHEALNKPGTATYKRWHEQVLTYNNGTPPIHGAIWMLYYPNIMIEWYPNVLVISTILPTGPQSCKNIVEFYYPEEIALFERDLVEAEQAAYRETAKEDEEICTRMQRGRHALYLQGKNETGPYQSPLEDGMIHFHEFLHRELDPFLTT
ncbi:MAG: aromatic ring-hydroxylating dioxygenase subunit alpha [Proteobacteria bacterium]|nr:aromatic ring-hydroxylating dioxygenase subunit alpha [Pseudomonadota bacterium]MDE3209039.1 aromatic ring-hydroxylating dioxygenase subunit alpha [Pseudomonadota bacterium]